MYTLCWCVSLFTSENVQTSVMGLKWKSNRSTGDASKQRKTITVKEKLDIIKHS